MGKEGRASWLMLVKRVFRSPSKEGDQNMNIPRQENVRPDQPYEGKKRDKRRWGFLKTPINDNRVQQCNGSREAASAHAPLQIGRPTRSCNLVTKHYCYAATVIQKAFRGYLARRALRALRGLVKLQALIRGQNIRRQAEVTLRCMRSLVRLQGQMSIRRSARPSFAIEASRRRSIVAETSNFLESQYLGDIRHRYSTQSRDGRDANCYANVDAMGWDAWPLPVDESGAGRKRATSTRDKTMTFSKQIWGAREQPLLGKDEEELESRKTRWRDRWMAAKLCERISNDTREPLKAAQFKTFKPLSSNSTSIQSSPCHKQLIPHSVAISSPIYRAPHTPSLYQSPITSSTPKIRPLQVHSRSPKSQEEKSYSTATTPSLFSYRLNPTRGRSGTRDASIPNYMAATESTKARARSQSAERQRPSAERRRSVRKRLSYPVDPAVALYDPHPHEMAGNIVCGSCSQSLRSPSLNYYCCEQHSNQCSCLADSCCSLEISPSSTTELGGWLR